MNLPVVLSPAADREFDAAAAWYEQKARLGERFVEQVQEALDRISQMPELHAMIYRTIRRARVPRGGPDRIVRAAQPPHVLAEFRAKASP